MRRLMAGGCVFAFSALLFISPAAVAAPQKSAAAHHTAKAQPAKQAKAGLKNKHSKNSKHTKSARHSTKRGARGPLEVHGPTEGRVIATEAGTNCVRFVQMNSDFGLSGKGSAWWSAAEGRFERGHTPVPGAVMVFKSSRKMSSGHVALVREVVDERHVLIDHSNWSAGRTGRVDLAVEAVDVSAANDWSQVQVWYGPINDMGLGVYPLHGFILPKSGTQVAQAQGAVAGGDTDTD